MIRILITCLFIFSFFLNGQALQAQRKKKEKIVPSFVYHRFGDKRYPSTNISKIKFEAHLKYLQKEGYTGVTLSEALDYLKNRGPQKKLVCLTVDDGFQSFYDHAFPLLQQYGFTATVFINTSSIDGADYMDWEVLREIQAAGFELGNHSHSHDYFLNDSSEMRLEHFASDLLQAQSLMDSLLGKRPAVYAYPYGEYDDSLKSVVAQSGIQAAAAQSSGIMHSGSDFYALPRFPMSDQYGHIGAFVEKLGMRPIKVYEVETIAKGYNGSPDNPRLVIKFPLEDLRIQGVQCFARGQRCTKSVRIDKDNNVQLTIKSKTPLTSRRSLYTITIPDHEGNWHWFSYTWVMTDRK